MPGSILASLVGNDSNKIVCNTSEIRIKKCMEQDIIESTFNQVLRHLIKASYADFL